MVRLSPFYDMLPMLYAPGAQGELGLRTFSPRPPVAGVMEVWSDAAGAPLDFWARVAGDDRISNRFRAVAAENGAIVERHVTRFGHRVKQNAFAAGAPILRKSSTRRDSSCRPHRQRRFAVAGQGQLFNDDYTQPDAADGEPVFWTDSAGQTFPADD